MYKDKTEQKRNKKTISGKSDNTAEKDESKDIGKTGKLIR